MPPLNCSLSPNREVVAAEVIDGEAIMIDLSTGAYDNMYGVAGWVWTLIEAERSPEEIVAAILARYEVAPARAETDVEKLLDELVRAKLVVVSDRKARGRDADEAAAEPKLSYDTPRLNSYHDMGDLLALDPPVPGLQDIPWEPPGGQPA
jgi:Coenzyme PQQ synthesis protein D (PqqD)